MELSDQIKLALLKNKLQALLQEQYDVMIALSVAVEVNNKAMVDRLQPDAELLRKTIKEYEKKITQLDTVPEKS